MRFNDPRLGERGDTDALNKSITLHRSMLKIGSTKPIELANNFANVLIRRFEVLGDEKDLNEAQEILEKTPELENDVSLSEFQAYPKALNALGNTFKQKVALSLNGEYYARAIEYYTKAEKFWAEDTAPYEWAMLQKNKAETSLLFAQTTSASKELIEKAIANAENSLKYRTEDQAPYQYQKSKDILQSLNQLKA